jgi:hypothetical protein
MKFFKNLFSSQEERAEPPKIEEKPPEPVELPNEIKLRWKECSELVEMKTLLEKINIDLKETIYALEMKKAFMFDTIKELNIKMSEKIKDLKEEKGILNSKKDYKLILPTEEGMMGKFIKPDSGGGK